MPAEEPAVVTPMKNKNLNLQSNPSGSPDGSNSEALPHDVGPNAGQHAPESHETSGGENQSRTSDPKPSRSKRLLRKLFPGKPKTGHPCTDPAIPPSENSALRAPHSFRRPMGKVAQLPSDIREQVNQMLFEGVTYQKIADQLRDLGHPGFNVQNIGRWQQHGHQQWLAQQSHSEDAKLFVEAAADLVKNGAGTDTLWNANDLFMAMQAYRSLAQLHSCKPEELITKHATAFAQVSRTINARLAERTRIECVKLQVDLREKQAAEKKEAEATQLDPKAPLPQEVHRSIMKKMDDVLGVTLLEPDCPDAVNYGTWPPTRRDGTPIDLPRAHLDAVSPSSLVVPASAGHEELDTKPIPSSDRPIPSSSSEAVHAPIPPSSDGPILPSSDLPFPAAKIPIRKKPARQPAKAPPSPMERPISVLNSKGAVVAWTPDPGDHFTLPTLNAVACTNRRFDVVAWLDENTQPFLSGEPVSAGFKFDPSPNLSSGPMPKVLPLSAIPIEQPPDTIPVLNLKGTIIEWVTPPDAHELPPLSETDPIRNRAGAVIAWLHQPK